MMLSRRVPGRHADPGKGSRADRPPLETFDDSTRRQVRQLLVRLRDRFELVEDQEDATVQFGPIEADAWHLELTDAIGWLADRPLPATS